MSKRLFAIPSLLAAGFMPFQSQAVPLRATPPLDGKAKSLFDVFTMDHIYTLAGHRSHSSHSSHRSHSSHSSHRSSTGGYSAAPTYSAPAPLYSPPPSSVPATPPASPPAASPSLLAPSSPALKTLPGNAQKFTDIVKEVQFAMLAFGYYNGELDGVLGPGMREGLKKLQADYNLKVTGTITPETLTALRIRAD